MLREELDVTRINNVCALALLTTRACEVAFENQLCFRTVQLQLWCFN